jgi:hypothetical protein
MEIVAGGRGDDEDDESSSVSSDNGEGSRGKRRNAPGEGQRRAGVGARIHRVKIRW